MSNLQLFLTTDSDHYTDRPTPEEGHTHQCLASAMISAIQNWRDSDGMTDHEFRLMAQDGDFLSTADEYLNSGLSDCLCPPKVREDRHYWTIYSFVAGHTYRTELFCTLTEAIMEAEESRALNPEVESTAVGRDIYNSGAVSYFWISIDFGKTL